MKRILSLMVFFSTTALLSASAWAAPVAPDNRCTATAVLTPSGVYTLSVPVVVPIVTSTSPASPTPNYTANFTSVPSSDGSLLFKLSGASATTAAPPFNCPAAALTTDASGAFNLDVPLLTFGGNNYSASLQQQGGPGGSTFKVTQVAPPPPPSPPPGIALQCVGVKHYSGYSVITVCTTLTNVPQAASQNLNSSLTTGSAAADKDSRTSISSTRYSGIPPNNQVTQFCRNYTITSYGPYSGLIGVSTDGGTAAVQWDINVGSTPVPCS